MFKTSIILILLLIGWQLLPKVEDDGWWYRESERIELSKKVELYQLRLENRGEAHPEVFEQLRYTTSKLSNLREKHARLIEEIEAGEQAFASYRQQTIAALRERSTGLVFESFQTGSGRTFKDVKVVSVSDAGVTIRHDYGSARLSYKDLTPRQRAEFGVEEVTALAAERTERERAEAYESWIEEEMDSLAVEQELAEKLNVKNTLAQASLTSKTSRPQATASRSRLSDAPKRFGTTPRYRARRSNYTTYYVHRNYYPNFKDYSYRFRPDPCVVRPYDRNTFPSQPVAPPANPAPVAAPAPVTTPP